MLDGSEWSDSRPGRFTPKEGAPGTRWIGGWTGSKAVLDAVVKRKIPSPHWESNPRTPIIQPVAQRYTDWAITALTSCLCSSGRSFEPASGCYKLSKFLIFQTNATVKTHFYSLLSLSVTVSLWTCNIYNINAIYLCPMQQTIKDEHSLFFLLSLRITIWKAKLCSTQFWAPYTEYWDLNNFLLPL
jgi:hypothetical protein